MVFITALFKNGPSWLPGVLKERVLDDSLLEKTFSTVIIYLMGPFKLNFITAFSFQCVLPENIHTPLSPRFSVWRGYSDPPPWNFLGCDVALRPPYTWKFWSDYWISLINQGEYLFNILSLTSRKLLTYEPNICTRSMSLCKQGYQSKVFN